MLWNVISSSGKTLHYHWTSDELFPLLYLLAFPPLFFHRLTLDTDTVTERTQQSWVPYVQHSGHIALKKGSLRDLMVSAVSQSSDDSGKGAHRVCFWDLWTERVGFWAQAGHQRLWESNCSIDPCPAPKLAPGWNKLRTDPNHPSKSLKAEPTSKLWATKDWSEPYWIDW